MKKYKYALDTTGSSVDNLIIDEEQFLTESNFKDYAYVIPDFAPFFINSLKVIHIQTDGSRKELTEGLDYYPALQYIAATRSIGRELWGGISFTNRGIQGTVEITYQTLGGTWTGDRLYVLESLAERNYNPRIAYWDDVTDVQEIFPVINHEQSFDTIYGQDKLIEAIDRLTDKVGEKGGMPVSYLTHLTNYNNPHKLTLEQLGYSIAELSDIVNNGDDHKLINIPVFFDKLSDIRNDVLDIDHRVSVIESNIADINNKLSSLDAKDKELDIKITENIRTLSEELHSKIDDQKDYLISYIDNKDNNLSDYITRVNNELSERIANAEARLSDTFLEALREHIDSKSNPHEVNKEQVGLGKVANYEMATDLDLQQGLLVDKYITLRQLVTYFNTYPTFTLSGYPEEVLPGDTIRLELTTERVPPKTVLMWKIHHYDTSPDMFIEDSGEFTTTGSTTYFDIRIKESILKYGEFRFAVNLYQGLDESTLVANTLSIKLIVDGTYMVDVFGSVAGIYNPDIEPEDMADNYYLNVLSTENNILVYIDGSECIRNSDYKPTYINNTVTSTSVSIYDANIPSELMAEAYLFNIDRTNNSSYITDKNGAEILRK